MIKFYMPEGVTIPVYFKLLVDGVFVLYNHHDDTFRFCVSCDDEAESMKIVEKIVEQIKREQSDYKHGVSWRTVWLKVVPQEERYKVGTVIDWKYLIHDSY